MALKFFFLPSTLKVIFLVISLFFGALVLNSNVHLHFFFYHYIVVIVPNNFANLLQAFNYEDIDYGEVDYVCALKFIVCPLFGLINPITHLLFAFDLECLFIFL